MNSIEVILLNYKGHSLHEFINKDEPLCPVIDFDLPIKILNAISPKLSDTQMKIYFAISLEMYI